MDIKKICYLTFTIFLGYLLSVIVHGMLEILLINLFMDQGLSPQPSSFGGGICFLPTYLRFFLSALGIIGGYFLGQKWWRIVYIEHRYGRNKK